MTDAHTDHGTVLKPEEAAITWSPHEGFSFLTPKFGDDETAPDAVIALARLALKLSDESFVRELVEEFQEETSAA